MPNIMDPPEITIEAGPGGLGAGVVVGGADPSISAPPPIGTELEITIGPDLPEFGITATGPLGGTLPVHPLDTPYGRSDLGYSFMTDPRFRGHREDILSTPEGRAWEDTYDAYAGSYVIYNPLQGGVSRNWEPGHRVRNFYDQQLAYYQGAIGPTVPPVFPTPPATRTAAVSEREDQWWDEPLNIIGGMAGDIAQRLGRAWIDYGIGRLEDIAGPPGYRPPRPPGPVMMPTPGIPPIMNIAPGRTTPELRSGLPGEDEFGVIEAEYDFLPGDPWRGQPMRPGLLFDPVPVNQGAEQMPNVPTAQPGGAAIPGGYTGAGVSCIAPGGATIMQRASMGMRLPSRVDVPTVDRSGNVRFTTFKNMGRPLLWSGDLAASKRVRKVAAKARRAKGR